MSTANISLLIPPELHYGTANGKTFTRSQCKQPSFLTAVLLVMMAGLHWWHRNVIRLIQTLIVNLVSWELAQLRQRHQSTEWCVCVVSVSSIGCSTVGQNFESISLIHFIRGTACAATVSGSLRHSLFRIRRKKS